MIAIVEADPLGADALRLLREAAEEARRLYPEHFTVDSPWPVNTPTPPLGVYLVAYLDGIAVGMGAHRPIDRDASEVRRVFVSPAARGAGIAEALMRELEDHARRQGFAHLRLETGNRQAPAMRLYERLGYARIDAFGPYVGDPTSVCFGKAL